MSGGGFTDKQQYFSFLNHISVSSSITDSSQLLPAEVNITETS